MLICISSLKRVSEEEFHLLHTDMDGRIISTYYKKKRLPKYLVYLDANNQYGWAMGQPLPTGSFRWLTGVFNECPERFDYGPQNRRRLT